jgi:acetylornithine/LysW-gamma-L-lysine aminotransferase
MTTDYKQLEHEYGVVLAPKRDLVAVRGKGALLYDESGEEYIDCVGGIGVASLGHAHPKIVEAVQQQAATLITCPHILYNDVRSKMLKKLVEVTPRSLTRAFLCNSGSEAVEAALKFARLHTKRPNFVTAMRGFHGRTMGAVSATFTKKYRESFEPLIPGFSRTIQQDRKTRSGNRRQHGCGDVRAGARRRRGQPDSGRLYWRGS